MLVVSVYFSPRDKRGCVPRDAYLLAQYADNLGEVNWGKYGVEETLDAVYRVQEAIRGSVRGFTIYGCHMYMHVCMESNDIS